MQRRKNKAVSDSPLKVTALNEYIEINKVYSDCI